MVEGRIQPDDAIFLLLPNQAGNNGYPRELHGGVASVVERTTGGATEITVHEFFRLEDINSRVKQFLAGNTPPQGNKALSIWNENSRRDALVLSSEDSDAPYGYEGRRVWQPISCASGTVPSLKRKSALS